MGQNPLNSTASTPNDGNPGLQGATISGLGSRQKMAAPFARADGFETHPKKQLRRPLAGLELSVSCAHRCPHPKSCRKPVGCSVSPAETNLPILYFQVNSGEGSYLTPGAHVRSDNFSVLRGVVVFRDSGSRANFRILQACQGLPSGPSGWLCSPRDPVENVSRAIYKRSRGHEFERRNRQDP